MEFGIRKLEKIPINGIKMKKNTNIQKIVLTIVFAIVLVFSLFFLSNFIRTSSREDWQARTSPLHQDVITDLCNKFNLSKEDQLCIPNHVVFAPDFYPVIENYYTKGVSSSQDVQVLLANYLVELEDLSYYTKDSTYFLAVYDFRGDGITALVFWFDGDHQTNKLKGYIEFFWEPGDLKAGEY